MKIQKILRSRFFPPVVLFIVCLASFGIFIPFLGIYSDDWIFLSVFQKFGHAGLTQYFHTNRPFWGLLYQLVMPLIGKSVYLSHIFAMFTQFTCGLAFMWLFLTLWPNKKTSALFCSILFVIYPGFNLLPISITFGNIYLVYSFFLLSTIFMIKAVKAEGKRKPLFIGLSLVFSLANLLMMEYFFCLVLIQPLLLWFHFKENQFSKRETLSRIFKFYWPWVLSMAAVFVWRFFIFQFQTYNYGLGTIEVMKKDFFSGIFIILKNYFIDLFSTGIYAWVEPIKYILSKNNQTTIFCVSVLFAVMSSIASFFLLRFYSKNNAENESETKFSWKSYILAFAALSLAGWPFWLTGLEVSLNGMYSRFTLPFIIGSCLLISSLLDIIKKPVIKLILVSILIGLAFGKSVLVMNGFRQEYMLASSYMNQLHKRIPALKPGAFIISNDLPFRYYSDASLSFMVDWFYAPHANGSNLDHVLVFAKDRAEDLSKQEYQFENVTFYFKSDLSKSINSVILFDYGVSPIGFNTCFTTLDQSNLVYYYNVVPEQSSTFAKYSKPDNINDVSNIETDNLFNHFFPDKYTNPWCMKFQELSTLRDKKEYQQIVDDYDKSVRPFYQLEILPYLDAFAQQNDWTQVNEILAPSAKISPDFVCSFLNVNSSRLKASDSEAKIVDQLKKTYQCH